METNNCETAVDIIAATEPEINKPATKEGNSFFASIGIACSESIFTKNSGPKYANETKPIKKAPETPGTTQMIAIFFDSFRSLRLFIAIYLISKCGWPKYPRPQLSPPRTVNNADIPVLPEKKDELLFLKISELNEAHRVSSISWDKFHRSIRIELLKSPEERVDVTYFMRTCRDEFDRLMETCPQIDKDIIDKFKSQMTSGDDRREVARKLKKHNA